MFTLWIADESVHLSVSQSATSLPLQRLSPSEVSSLSFIYSFVDGWICQFEQAKLGDWQQVWSKRRVHKVEEREREIKKKKRLWQSSIWPRLLSESSLACQISVLTVNSHICAEHRRVSCTMVSWFRIRLDKAIGWMTHRQTHFHFLSNSLSRALCNCLDLRMRSVNTYFNQVSLFVWKLTINENPAVYWNSRKQFLAHRLNLAPSDYWTMRNPPHTHSTRALLFLPRHCNILLIHTHRHTHTRPITSSLAWIIQELDSSLLTIAQRLGRFLLRSQGLSYQSK